MPKQEAEFLTFASLHPGRTLGPGPFPVTAGLVSAYVDITGDANPIYTDDGAARAAGFDGPVMPPGLAGVWARRSYLTEHRMLPGGVMAGQNVELYLPVSVGSELSLTAVIGEVDEEGDRRRVLLDCSAMDEAGRLAGRVEIDARWPQDPS
ncbi:MAG TPA: MaoC family dehydratase [Acidimicrobiales bacterium]|nr:MaoC family dehydratase [Acidimicrobiales bacterium]